MQKLKIIGLLTQKLSMVLFLLPQLQAQGIDLVARVGLEDSQSAIYSLNYREYPVLVAAFLYIAQQEPGLYQQVQYVSKNQGSYGKASISLPSKLYSLPNTPSVSHPQPGLAFVRNGSVLRSDILVLSTAKVGLRDQNNLVFFADLQQTDKSSLSISRNKGLNLLHVEARSSTAEHFLSSLNNSDQETYMEKLEQLWQKGLRTSAPAVFALLQQSDDWQRDAFGYYIRTVEKGRGSLPQVGEDLNITLERKAFAGFQAQSLPVIVGFGKDVLPMPFSYFVAQTPKGSQVEILCPPSAARSTLSTLSPEYGGTRYQWLLESYAHDTWVYLSFSLEIP